MMRRSQLHMPLAVVAGMLILAIALLAIGSLWFLRRAHNQLAHVVATKSVLERGKRIAAYLADQWAVAPSSDQAQDWSQFSRLARSLHTLENGLQYVSVSRDGVTVFHEQMTTLDGPSASEAASPPPVRPIAMSRKFLRVADGTLPVVSFTIEFADTSGKPQAVEVALRRETVGREERAAAEAISSMFRVALLTLIVSFGFCSLMVAWMMHRETARAAMRRQEEHLAFSGVLANGIVHDFRNPMSSLRLDIQMLNKETEKGAAYRPERIAQLAGRVRNTLERMDKVFEEFLYLSKPASGERERINLVPFIRDCVEMLAPRFEHSDVRVELDLPAEPLDVWVFPSSLRRALVNVVTNAEQFSPKGEDVLIRVARSNDKAVVDVLDRGPGIPRSERKRIFEMFVSSRPGGTGLGLFLARTAIERSGGTIEFHARSGGGSCFRIHLPTAGPKA